MQLSRVLVKYIIGNHKYKDCHFYTEQTFQGFSIPAANPEYMSPDIIYICLLSEALKIQHTVSNLSFICVQDRVLSDQEADLFTNMILIQENINLGDLYSILTAKYGIIADWHDRSTTALLGGCRYQRLLDLAEAVIQEPIYVMDPTFKLLAHTKNYSSPDPMNISLEAFGYHTDETIELLKQNHRLELYSHENGLIINEPGFSLFPTITKCFNLNKKTELIVTLVCVNSDFNDALQELFRMLTIFLHVSFKNTYRSSSARLSPKDMMLYKLIYEDESGPFTVAERARSSSLPITGKFILFRIMYDTEPNILIDKATERFKAIFPDEHVFSHNYEITIVSVLPAQNNAFHIKELTEKLAPLLEEHNMICGISPTFSNLYDIKQASWNATTALSFGRKFTRRGRFFDIPESIWTLFTRTPEGKIFCFDNLFEFVGISSFLASHEVLDSEPIQQLRALQEYDNKHHSSLLLILLCFLMYGRRATDAGTALHMHRNNVVYTINKVQEMLGIDLGDLVVCEKLQYAFKLLSVANADKEETKT